MEESRTKTTLLILLAIGIVVYIIATVVCSALKMSFAAIMWIPIVLFFIALPFILLFRSRKNKREVYGKIKNKEKRTKYEQILLDIENGTFEKFLNKFSFKTKLYNSFRNEEPEIMVTGGQDDNDIEIFFEKTCAEISINEETDKPLMIKIRYSNFKSVADLYDNIVKEVEDALQ